jgi:adenylate cyclase
MFPVTGAPAEACEAALRAVGAARAGIAHFDATLHLGAIL